jgi:HAD superfamily hydrolase (TIGR01490 family)
VTRVVAAFDFDGTLTRRDTLAPFLLRTRGRVLVARSTLRHAPALALAGTGRGSRDEAKARLLRALFRDVPAAVIASAGEHYATHVLARALRNDTLARLQWHQREGHEVVLITASLASYARPVAGRLGIETVYATTLEADGDLLTGELVGGNMRGPEKARALEAHLRGEEAVVWAYGDSAGDRELLAAADHAVLVKGIIVTPTPGG